MEKKDLERKRLYKEAFRLLDRVDYLLGKIEKRFSLKKEKSK